MSGFIVAASGLLLAAGVIGTWFGAAPLTEPPDFSGTWTLNVPRSDFGPFPAPQRRTDVIDHREEMLKVTRREVTASGQERVGEWTCKTDGRECTNTMGRTPMRSRASWEEATLVVATRTTFEGQEATVEDRWVISPDGRTLTISRSAVSPQGTAHQTFVLERP